jgi:hypothetical protein
MSRARIVGDVHGHLDEFRGLLARGGLVDERSNWTGGDDVLVVLGDTVDRGRDGIGVLDLLMQLERQAQDAGGAAYTVIGNHEVQLLAAWRFGTTGRGTPGRTFRGDWHRWGGLLSDLEALEARHVAWLEHLPAMLLVGNDLLIHADSPFYLDYGATLAAVNAAFTSVLVGDDSAQYETLMREFLHKRAFQGAAGVAVAEAMLARFGGTRIIHGHSPIANITGQPAETVTGALVYANGRCVNVDHGLYLGGPGFIFDSSS